MFINPYIGETACGADTRLSLLSLDSNFYSVSSVSNRIRVFNLSLKKSLNNFNKFYSTSELHYYDFKSNNFFTPKGLIPNYLGSIFFTANTVNGLLPRGVKFLHLNYHSVCLNTTAAARVLTIKPVATPQINVTFKNITGFATLLHTQKNFNIFENIKSAPNVYNLEGHFFIASNIAVNNFSFLVTTESLAGEWVSGV